MSFARLQERLREEGWFVQWKMPCCQTCAWAELPFEHPEGPFEGKEIDFSKVLFNHEQDCEADDEYDVCGECMGEGEIDDGDESIYCEACDGSGEIYEPRYLEAHEASGSMFCFDGNKKGTQNLVDILPLIEESGCSWHWDKSGTTRIEISW